MNEPRNREFPGNEAIPVVYPPYLAAPCQEDEISLVDLWLELKRYRKAFWSVFLALLTMGLAYFLSVYQPKYGLTTAIQIGAIYEDGKTIPLEDPASLLSKVKSAIIPSYTREWLQQSGYENVIDTKASNPKNSSIILLENRIRDSELSLFKQFQQGLANQVVADHARLVESLLAPIRSELALSRLQLEEMRNPVTLALKKKPLEIKLDEAKINKKKLEDPAFFGVKKKEFENQIVTAQHEKDQLKQKARVLQEQMQRIESSRSLLEKHIERLQKQIEAAAATRLEAAKQANEASAMSQLLIGNEIQQNQQRLLSLEERYNVTLPNEKSKLQKDIEANNLALIDKQRSIDILKQKYEQMLLDNKLQIERLALDIAKLELQIDKLEMNHQKAVDEQELKIEQLMSKLKNYNETRIVGQPAKSLEPVGLKPKLLVVLIVFLAGFAGFMAMLLWLFRDKVMQRQQELEMEHA